MTSQTASAPYQLPAGYCLEQDGDGDWILWPPEDVTIFSVPGEGFLIGTCSYAEAMSDAAMHLSAFPSPAS